VGGVGLARCRDLRVSTVAPVSFEELATVSEDAADDFEGALFR